MRSTTSRLTAEPILILRRLQDAINRHDLDAMEACFAADYDSQFPAHPERAFRGRAGMRQNWQRIFSALPDITAELRGGARDGDTVWAEWEWSGTRRDGEREAFRGVTIQGVRDGRVSWVRLYMEPVRTDREPPTWLVEGRTS